MQTKIYNLQTTSKIEKKKKTKVGTLQLAPHFMITNRLLPRHFLSFQIYVVIHPLCYFFHLATRWALFTQQKSGHRFWSQCVFVFFSPFKLWFFKKLFWNFLWVGLELVLTYGHTWCWGLLTKITLTLINKVSKITIP